MEKETKEAPIEYCHKCKGEYAGVFKWWQRKVRGYYIRFCNNCGYGNYNERPEANMETNEGNTPVKNIEEIKDRNYLINFYNATSTDDGSGEIETYEYWLERQLLARIGK